MSDPALMFTALIFIAINIMFQVILAMKIEKLRKDVNSAKWWMSSFLATNGAKLDAKPRPASTRSIVE